MSTDKEKIKVEFIEKLKDSLYKKEFFDFVKSKFGSYVVSIDSINDLNGYHLYYIIYIGDNEFNKIEEIKVKSLNDNTPDRKKIDKLLNKYNSTLDNVMKSGNNYHGTLNDIKFKTQLLWEVNKLDFKINN